MLTRYSALSEAAPASLDKPSGSQLLGWSSLRTLWLEQSAPRHTGDQVRRAREKILPLAWDDDR
jgi:hypothetical protein